MKIQSSHLSKIYKAGWGNLTDMYQLTMAYGYWQKKIHERKAVFHLFFRNHPFKGNFTVAAGLALVADFLQHFSYSTAEIQYLGSLKGNDGKPLFSESFLHYLQRLSFTGDVYAVPEGTLVFPHEPVIRIEAPLLQAQLIETALLTFVNFSSLIATKGARMRRAAGSDLLLEFGLRRAQGADGALTASRSAYIGGCDATSNVWAGQHLNIPVQGTHGHSWVMVFGDEKEAFAAYANAMPNNCTFLVDTYDTLEGTRNAIEIGKELREKGGRLAGIRLDSGDLTDLSKRARLLLDEAGFTDTTIIATNDLDEYQLSELKHRGAQITSWGIGTRLATAYDQPAMGGVYKLAAIANEAGEMEPRIKLSEQEAKISNPGPQQIRRYYDADGIPVGDIIYQKDKPADEIKEMMPIHLAGPMPLPASEQVLDLLVPIFKGGEICYDFPSLAAIRAHCQREREQFGRRPDKAYVYGLERELNELKEAMIKDSK